MQSDPLYSSSLCLTIPEAVPEAACTDSVKVWGAKRRCGRCIRTQAAGEVPHLYLPEWRHCRWAANTFKYLPDPQYGTSDVCPLFTQCASGCELPLEAFSCKLQAFR